jgi:hypothetical protein
MATRFMVSPWQQCLAFGHGNKVLSFAMATRFGVSPWQQGLAFRHGSKV